MNTNRVLTNLRRLGKTLDGVKSDVAGMPNLLTPNFDNIKNVLSTITTKVDNVRGGWT